MSVIFEKFMFRCSCLAEMIAYYCPHVALTQNMMDCRSKKLLLIFHSRFITTEPYMKFSGRIAQKPINTELITFSEWKNSRVAFKTFLHINGQAIALGYLTTFYLR